MTSEANGRNLGFLYGITPHGVKYHQSYNRGVNLRLHCPLFLTMFF